MTGRQFFSSCVLMVLFALVVLAILHQADAPAPEITREDRISVLMRTCFQEGTVRADMRICQTFADEIREAADAAEKETAMARAGQ